MQNKKKEQIYDALAKLAVLFDEPPSEERLFAMCEVLSTYPMSDITLAIKRATIESERFPTIARLVKYMKPDAILIEDVSNQVASEIIASISRYGRYNYTEAKKSMSDIAVQVVECFGGWSLICETTQSNLGILRAQLRDIAKSQSRNIDVKKLTSTKVKMIDTKE